MDRNFLTLPLFFHHFEWGKSQIFHLGRDGQGRKGMEKKGFEEKRRKIPANKLQDPYILYTRNKTH